METDRGYLNPIDVIHSVGWPQRDFISYDPDMPLKSDGTTFFRCRQARHDGTRLFTLGCLQELLLPIVNMESFHKATIKNVSGDIASVRYTLSPIRHSMVFGVKVNDVVRNGMRERFTVYVRPEYLDGNGAVLKEGVGSWLI